MRFSSTNPFKLLGSENALNWRNHVFFVVPAMLTAGFFDFERLGGDPNLWLLLALAGYLVSVFSIDAGRRIIWRLPNQQSRWWTVIVLLLAAGFVRGLVIFQLGQLLGVIPEDDIVYRLVGGPVFVFSAYLASNAVVTLYLNYRGEVERLQIEKQRLDRVRGTYTSDLRAVNQQQRDRVRELLAAPIWELQKKLSAAKDPAGLQDALLTMQAINNEVVRPLSHQLSATTSLRTLGAEEVRPAQRLFSRWPERIQLSQVLPLWLYLTIILTVGLNAQIAASTFLRGIAIVAVTMIPIMGFFFLERWTIGKLSLRLSTAVVISSLFGIGAGLSGGLLAISVGLATTDNYWWQTATYLLLTKLTTLTFGILEQSWRRSVAEMREVTEQLQLVNSRLRQQLWLGQKSLAMELHGSVQGTLHALAARLARMKDPNESEIQEILVTVRSSLDRIENEDYLAGGTLDSLMAELQLLWEGTADISWETSESAQQILESDMGLARCVFEIVRETTTNSVKHGKADSISYKFDVDDSVLSLLVTNNGSLIEERTGFAGSELFDQLCLSHELWNSGSEVLFRAELALSPKIDS